MVYHTARNDDSATEDYYYNDNQRTQILSSGAVAGIVIGGAVALAILSVCCLLRICRRRGARQENAAYGSYGPFGGVAGAETGAGRPIQPIWNADPIINTGRYYAPPTSPPPPRQSDKYSRGPVRTTAINDTQARGTTDSPPPAYDALEEPQLGGFRTDIIPGAHAAQQFEQPRAVPHSGGCRFDSDGVEVPAIPRSPPVPPPNVHLRS